MRITEIASLLVLGAACAIAPAQTFGPSQPGPAIQTPTDSPAVLPAGGDAEPTRSVISDTESKPLGAPQPLRSADPARAASPRSAMTELAKTIPALLGVLTIAAALAYIYKRFGTGGSGIASGLGASGRAPSGLLEVLGRYPVARGSSLVLLKLDRRVLLLNQSAGGRLGGAKFTTLAEITEPEDVASILIKAGEDDGLAARAKFQHALQQVEAEAPVDGEPTTIETAAAVDSLRRRLDSLRSSGRA